MECVRVPEDEEFVTVLASVLGRKLDLEQMEDSLTSAELRARQHAERLEALWRAANNPNLHGCERVIAMRLASICRSVI